MAVKKAKQLGGKANYHKARDKGKPRWLEPQESPSLESIFKPIEPPSKAITDCEPVRVKYVLSCKPHCHSRILGGSLFTVLWIVLDSEALKRFQALLGKRSWGEMTPNLVLLDAETGSERGCLSRARYMDSVKPSRFGSGLFEVDLLGAEWRPGPGFVFDTPMPALKMWGDKKHD